MGNNSSDRTFNFVVLLLAFLAIVVTAAVFVVPLLTRDQPLAQPTVAPTQPGDLVSTSTSPASPQSTQQSIPTRSVPQAPTDAVYLVREDFRDGSVQMEGFSSGSNKWRIVTDETGDAVYEVDNRNEEDYAGFSFGADSWSDYAAAYQVRYLNDTGSIGLQLRSNGNEYYVLDLGLSDIYLAYGTTGGDWTRLSTKLPFIETNIWYDVRAEVRGNQIGIYIDNAPWISESDDRFDRGWLLMYASPNTYAQVDNINVWELVD